MNFFEASIAIHGQLKEIIAAGVQDVFAKRTQCTVIEKAWKTNKNRNTKIVETIKINSLGFLKMPHEGNSFLTVSL